MILVYFLVVVMNPNDIGFDDIYQGERFPRRGWSNFWSPLCVATVAAITSTMVIVYPVITTATPGKISNASAV